MDDPTFLFFLLALGSALFVWHYFANAKKAKAASEQMEKDSRLYQHINAGLREYESRAREKDNFWEAKNRELLFETADLSAFYVDHHAESRVGFYFKDLDEYGLYCVSSGIGDEFIDTYYRTDSTFQKQERLLYDEEMELDS